MSARRIAEIAQAIQAAAAEALNKKNFGEIMVEVADIVRLRTRLGYGVQDDGAAKERLKPLAGSYREQRANKARYWTGADGKVRRREIESGGGRHPQLSDDTTPGKSNLTFTGQMLDSLKGRATSAGRGEVAASGNRRGGGASNPDVARYVSEQGRPFLNLSDVEIRRVTDLVKRSIIAKVNSKLTKLE